MNSIFEHLWSGKLAPCERCAANDPEIRQLAQLAERNRQALEATLTPEQLPALEKHITCCEELDFLFTVHVFREGFSLACRLLKEAL